MLNVLSYTTTELHDVYEVLCNSICRYAPQALRSHFKYFKISNAAPSIHFTPDLSLITSVLRFVAFAQKSFYRLNLQQFNMQQSFKISTLIQANMRAGYSV